MAMELVLDSMLSQGASSVSDNQLKAFSFFLKTKGRLE